jgi:hypothetical protein
VFFFQRERKKKKKKNWNKRRTKKTSEKIYGRGNGMAGGELRKAIRNWNHTLRFARIAVLNHGDGVARVAPWKAGRFRGLWLGGLGKGE